jgi:TPR repeat protein
MKPIFAVLFLLVCITACRSKAEYAQIRSQHIENTVAKANAGDVKSAKLLARHFLFGKNDIENGKKWLYRAAELGDSGSCLSLKNMEEPTPPQCNSLGE